MKKKIRRLNQELESEAEKSATPVLLGKGFFCSTCSVVARVECIGTNHAISIVRAIYI